MTFSLFPSLSRTVVPIVAGWVLTFLTGLGVDFSSTTVTSVVTAGFSAAYYLVFRLLERVSPEGGAPEKIFGVLLGYARRPEYPEPAARHAKP
jgi:hypothetical protein